ncbi:uncharacterized protein LOC111620086 [Centruroides sculpturatus]|uniref:uncharacterized protein LOC111620086 n=1 Tax=Centruroides sculpturatus TaxID=218467 RepID=UPI000C6DE6E8|nr:uncharacterized protein LOC111620086 [Centruroides sculpturatus]
MAFNWKKWRMVVFFSFLQCYFFSAFLGLLVYTLNDPPNFDDWNKNTSKIKLRFVLCVIHGIGAISLACFLGCKAILKQCEHRNGDNLRFSTIKDIEETSSDSNLISMSRFSEVMFDLRTINELQIPVAEFKFPSSNRLNTDDINMSGSVSSLDSTTSVYIYHPRNRLTPKKELYHYFV